MDGSLDHTSSLPRMLVDYDHHHFLIHEGGSMPATNSSSIVHTDHVSEEGQVASREGSLSSSGRLASVTALESSTGAVISAATSPATIFTASPAAGASTPTNVAGDVTARQADSLTPGSGEYSRGTTTEAAEQHPDSSSQQSPLLRGVGSPSILGRTVGAMSTAPRTMSASRVGAWSGPLGSLGSHAASLSVSPAHSDLRASATASGGPLGPTLHGGGGGGSRGSLSAASPPVLQGGAGGRGRVVSVRSGRRGESNPQNGAVAGQPAEGAGVINSSNCGSERGR